MSSSKMYKPGEKAERTGTYELVDSNGTKTGMTVKVNADDHFPPSDKRGQKYSLKSSK
ncbi:MAG: YjzC family protein [Clostridiales bacterium]|nr:YjzC family protein [Clostridiales bacterium]